MDQEGTQVVDLAPSDLDGPVPSIGFVPAIDNETSAERSLHRTAAKGHRNLREVHRRFVATGVWFVRKFPSTRVDVALAQGRPRTTRRAAFDDGTQARREIHHTGSA